MTSPRVRLEATRVIALLEAIKGIVVIAAGFGALSLLHHDLRHLAVALVTRLHIDPAGHRAGLFIALAGSITDARLWGLAAMAFAYSLLRFVEAYGLWHVRPWAYWLGCIGGLIYVPVEALEIFRHATAIRVGTLVVNVAIVLYLAGQLRRRARLVGSVQHP